MAANDYFGYFMITRLPILFGLILYTQFLFLFSFIPKKEKLTRDTVLDETI